MARVKVLFFLRVALSLLLPIPLCKTGRVCYNQITKNCDNERCLL